MTFEDLKRTALNDILDRKKISLEERYELNGLMNKIETTEHLKEFVDGLETMFPDKPVHLRNSHTQKVSQEFGVTLKEFLESTENKNVD